MSIPPQLAALTGQWQGTNRLWLQPGTPVRESESLLTISLVGQGKYATFHYTWADEGIAQDGLLIVGSAGQSGETQAAWIDSWHMQDKILACEGGMESNGGFSVKGGYAAPPGPDWGWRIAAEPQDAGALRFTMYNITPDGQEFLAVETIYRKF